MRIALSAVSVAVGMTAFAYAAIADDRAQDPRQIATEVRVLTVPAGFRERAGIRPDAGRGLTEPELCRLMEAAQGLRDANVMQFPRVTSFDGQAVTIRVGERRMFLTGGELTKVKGQVVFVPKNSPVELGDTLNLSGSVSADGKHVNLQAKLSRTTLIGEVELVPVTTTIMPLFEDGARGQAIPFTQYLQATEFETKSVEKKVVVPDGGTIVIGGWRQTVNTLPPPMITKIPYAEKLFKSGSREKTFEVIVLATARVLFFGAEEAGKPGDVKEAKKDK